MATLEKTNGHIDEVPPKTREVLNHHMDSTIWNELEMRPDDIVIATYAKSGTTVRKQSLSSMPCNLSPSNPSSSMLEQWTQQIVSQLIFKGDPSVAPGAVSPWAELRIVPQEVMISMLREQKHRRFIKTHLPRDALKWDPSAKYLFIGRDGRDMIWSAHNHFNSATPAFYEMFDSGNFDGPKLTRPSSDPRDMLMDLLDREDGPNPAQLWPFWSHIRGWWEVKDHPNLLFVHYNDLKADLNGEMRRIADFLELPDLTDQQWKDAVEHCTFEWMKANAELVSPPQADLAFENGAQSFINKGTNSRWRDRLSEEDIARYEATAKRELGEECAHWLQYEKPEAKLARDLVNF